MSDWRDPQDWSGVQPPSRLGDRRVRLLVDFGAGQGEVAGRAWSTDNADPSIVYSDVGGWCTQYVLKWKPFDGDRDEIDDQQDADDTESN